jgi:hypothetical protein
MDTPINMYQCYVIQSTQYSMAHISPTKGQGPYTGHGPTEVEATMEDVVVDDGNPMVGLLARLDEVAAGGSQQTTVFKTQLP